MSKWHYPIGLLLLVAILGNTSGCAQTSEWLAKRTEKKSKDKKELDEEVVASTKKPKEKSAKAKSSKELADAKTREPKSDPVKKKQETKASEKSETKISEKVVDREHEKYANAERAKKKARQKPAATKDDSSLVAKDTTATTKSKAVDQSMDDDLETLLTPIDPDSKIAKNTASKKSVAKTRETESTKTASIAKPEIEDPDPFEEEDFSHKKKDVLQVKTEDARNEDEADSEMDAPKTASKPIKNADLWDSFEDDAETPIDTSDKKKTPKKKQAPSEKAADTDWDDGLLEASSEPHAKSGTKKDASSRGMLASCPKAEGELHDTLISMDPDDVESLRNGLHRIGQMSGVGTAAKPLLLKMLKNDDAFVRTHAALAMVRLGIVSEESVIVVTTSLKADDGALHSFAVQVMDEMGTQTKDVLSVMSESLQDPSGQIRMRAADVLMDYEEWRVPALKALLGCLKDKDDNVRWLATYSIAEIQPQAAEVVQALLKAVSDPVPKVREGAAYALGELGPIAKPARAELRRIAEKTDDEDLKKTIAYSLKQMEKETREETSSNSK